VKLFIVLVLYRIELSYSTSWTTLCRAMSANRKLDVEVLVVDNSLESGLSLMNLREFPFTAVHDPSNGGLVSAYNVALKRAERAHADWMLLLDQDSVLPRDFISKTVQAISECDADATVAAVVPRVKGSASWLSPKRVHPGFVTDVRADARGRCDYEITAINSGTALRVSALREIGGFSRKYWLDFLDYWVFRTLYNCGRAAYVSDAHMMHSLSLETNALSSARYHNILTAECRFVKEEGRRIELPLYFARLFARMLKHTVQGSFEFARLDGVSIFRLLTWTPKRELRG
jgi:GT2 family glycosyltransferase